MTRQTWRERLDARISRCKGCDGLQWDGKCPRCEPVTNAPTPFSEEVQ